MSALAAIARIFRSPEGVSVNVTRPFSWTGYVKQVNPDWQRFSDALKPAAKIIETEYLIPWKFAVIQAGHESRQGDSRLAREAFNLFGITGDSWYTQGKPVYWIMTTEFGKDGTKFEIKRPFRKYESWEESLRDWASLIQRRYPIAYEAAKKNDFEAFAYGLQIGGYATDRDPKTKELVYAKKLIQLNKELEGLA